MLTFSTVKHSDNPIRDNSMSRILLACLFLRLTTTSLPSQSSLAPTSNPRARVNQSDPTQFSGGDFAPAMTYDGGAMYTDWIAVADLNGDGVPDLVVSNRCAPSACGESGPVSVLLGNGDGTFQGAVDYSPGGSGQSPTASVAIADVNGDGKPDIAVVNSCWAVSNDCGTVSILLGNGDGTFQTPASYSTGASGPTSVTLADVNGDGNPDLMVTNICPYSNYCPESIVSVLLGNGDGTFQPATTYNSGGFYSLSLAVADVNSDGKPDLLVSNYFHFPTGDDTDGVVAVLLGNGDGTFQSAIPYDSGGYTALSVAVADVNGDGKPDLLVTNECAFYYTNYCPRGTVGVLLGNGDGSFQTAVPYGSGGFATNAVAVADVNGDSNPDLVVSNQCSDDRCQSNGTVGVLLGNGDGTFQPAMSYGPGGNTTASLAVADVNGDGKPDILVANMCATGSNCSNGTVGVLLNTTATTALLSSTNPSVSGKPVTLTASVSSLAGTPTGKIRFLNGTTVLATVKLTSGSAKYTTSKLPPGANHIIAVYQGDSSSSGPSAAVSQVVLSATTTALTSSPNPAISGQDVTFTAVVVPTPPDGETVMFMDGTTVLGTESLASGLATCTTSALPVGMSIVTVTYGGDVNFGASTSKKLKQTVKKEAPS